MTENIMKEEDCKGCLTYEREEDKKGCMCLV